MTLKSQNTRQSACQPGALLNISHHNMYAPFVSLKNKVSFSFFSRDSRNNYFFIIIITSLESLYIQSVWGGWVYMNFIVIFIYFLIIQINHRQMKLTFFFYIYYVIRNIFQLEMKLKSYYFHNNVFQNPYQISLFSLMVMMLLLMLYICIFVFL